MTFDCKFCGLPNQEWRMNENTGKGIVWDTNLGLPHNCSKKQEAFKDKPKDNIDQWLETYHKRMKFLIPIWCVQCGMPWKPNSVCKHLRSQGFKEGIHGADFTSDSPRMVELRKQYKISQEVMADPQRNIFQSY